MGCGARVERSGGRGGGHTRAARVQEQKLRLERLQTERDARDALDAEARGAAEQRLTWLFSYQSVAKARMEAQQAQLAPLMVAAKQSAAELHEAQALQV